MHADKSPRNNIKGIDMGAGDRDVRRTYPGVRLVNSGMAGRRRCPHQSLRLISVFCRPQLFMPGRSSTRRDGFSCWDSWNSFRGRFLLAELFVADHRSSREKYESRYPRSSFVPHQQLMAAVVNGGYILLGVLPAGLRKGGRINYCGKKKQEPTRTLPGGKSESPDTFPLCPRVS